MFRLYDSSGELGLSPDPGMNLDSEGLAAIADPEASTRFTDRNKCGSQSRYSYATTSFTTFPCTSVSR